MAVPLLLALGLGFVGITNAARSKNYNVQRKYTAGKLPPNASSDYLDHEAFQMNEDRTVGMFKTAYLGGKSFFTEETKMIRPIRRTGLDPKRTGMQVHADLRRKNAILGRLSAAVGKNRLTIIKPSFGTKVKLLGLPNEEGFEAWKNVPNAWFDRKTAAPHLDNIIDNYNDQFGDAGSAPMKGRPNTFTPIQYYGNPWGAGGQLYVHYKDGADRDDGFNGPTTSSGYVWGPAQSVAGIQGMGPSIEQSSKANAFGGAGGKSIRGY